MEIEARHIITGILVVFKVYVILNFILKFRKMKKRVAELEQENQILREQKENTIHQSA